jgi:hypothetical protein
LFPGVGWVPPVDGKIFTCDLERHKNTPTTSTRNG